MPTKEESLSQIERALKLYDEYRRRGRYDDLSDHGSDVHHEVKAVVSGTLDRLASPGSAYRATLNGTLISQIGSLRALQRDYKEGLAPTLLSETKLSSAIRLFISHSSDDAALVSLLVDLIKTALLLPSNAIRCTTIDGYRLPGTERIKS